jgi:hypothetical protein
MFGKERSWFSEAAVEKDDNLCTLFSQDLGCHKYFWEKYCTGKKCGIFEGKNNKGNDNSVD